MDFGNESKGTVSSNSVHYALRNYSKGKTPQDECESFEQMFQHTPGGKIKTGGFESACTHLWSEHLWKWENQWAERLAVASGICHIVSCFKHVTSLAFYFSPMFSRNKIKSGGFESACTQKVFRGNKLGISFSPFVLVSARSSHTARNNSHAQCCSNRKCVLALHLIRPKISSTSKVVLFCVLFVCWYTASCLLDAWFYS